MKTIYNFLNCFLLLGRLESNNNIVDGFYDTGCKFLAGGTGVQDGTVFESVENLAKQEINHMKPVIYVNFG